MGLGRFVWYGFCLTAASLSFTGNFYSTSMPGFADEHQRLTVANPNAIGLHAIWAFLVVGLVALVVALAFAKMSQLHFARQNGAAYIYTRSAFGRFTGFFVGCLNYVGLPFLITIQILYFMRGLFGGGYIGHAAPQLVAKWGPFTNLWLDLLSVVIYLGVATTVFLGVRVFKWISTFTSVTSFLVMSVSIVLMFVFFAKFARPSFEWWNHTPHENKYGVPVGGGNVLHPGGILYAFGVFFFSFAGFETFSTAGHNIAEPERNIPLGIKLVMLFSILWYVIFATISFGVWWGDDGEGNHHLLQHNLVNFWGRKTIGGIGSVGFWFGIVQAIILEIFFVVRMSSENALYGGTQLQPFAQEGYIPEKFKELSANDKFPRKASAVNLIITAGVIFFWLVIPDLIIGIMKVQRITAIKSVASVFSVGLFLSTSSFFTVVVYAFVVAALLKSTFVKKADLTRWEIIMYIAALLFLLFTGGYYWFNSIHSLVQGVMQYDAVKIIAGILKPLYFIIVTGVITGLYRFYYLPKLRRRLKTNPVRQRLMDADFVILDDWRLIGLRMQTQLQRYLQRHQRLRLQQSDQVKANLEVARKLQTAIKDSIAQQVDHRTDSVAVASQREQNVATVKAELNV